MKNLDDTVGDAIMIITYVLSAIALVRLLVFG